MPSAFSHLLSIIELALVSFMIFRCDSINIPASNSETNDVTTINSYVQDSVFSCTENSCPPDSYTLNHLYFKLISAMPENNTVMAPLPTLSVLTMLTENATDTSLLDLRSKIPCCFFKVDSAIQQNGSTYSAIKMESIFWGQSKYLFSTHFLNTLYLCKGIRLKSVDFVRSGSNFNYTLNNYIYSLSDTFEYIPFYIPDYMDSMRGVFTSTFCVNSSFDSSVVDNANSDGTFQNKLGNIVVTKGIRFKKGLKTYQDSALIVYEIALHDTSLQMYVFTGIDTCFQHVLQKILHRQLSFSTDTITQLWLPFVSITHQFGIDGKYNDGFYNYFSIPINDTLIDYSYINHNGSLKISNVTSSTFFSLSSSLTFVSNAAVWLKATSKENYTNWHGDLGLVIDADCHFNLNAGNDILGHFFSNPIPDCKPFMVVLIHKVTNSVLSAACITTVQGTPELY